MTISLRQPRCQAFLDVPFAHLVQQRGLGTPDDSRDAFRRLKHAGVLTEDLAARLLGMVGFRNIAVHRYHQLDMSVLRSILDERLDDLLRFAEVAAKSSND